MMQNSGDVYEKVRELISLEGTTLLDVGAGTGDFVKTLSSWIKVDVCGYEKIDNLKFKHVDLNKDNLPYKNNSFKLTTCIEVIEHVENPFKLIRELARVTKKDGVCVLTTPNVQSWYYRLYYAFTGKLLGFNQIDGYSFDHTTPIHWQIFKPYLEKYFDIEVITGNRSIIPLVVINLPFDGLAFSDSVILKMRKK